MKLKEPIDDVGLFWRAGDDQRHAVPGRLTIDEGGRTNLEIWGEAAVEPTSLVAIGFSQTGSGPLRLHGICHQLGAVTLDECQPSGYEIRTTGKTKTVTRLFFTRSVYCGVPFGESETIMFDRGFIQIEGVVSWMRKSGLKATYDEKFPDTTFSIKSPKPIHITLADNLDLTFHFQGTTPTPAPWSTEVAITRTCSIELTSGNPLTSNEFREMVWRLTSFFAFVTDMPVAPTAISCIVKAEERHQDKGLDDNRRTTVYDGHLRQGTGLSTSHPSFMLIDYTDCAGELETILQRWWTLATDIPVAIRLMQNEMYRDDAWLNEQFLDLTRVIEVLHRYEFQKEKVSMYRRIKDEIQPFERLFGGAEMCHQLATAADELRNRFTHLNLAQQIGKKYEEQLLNVHMGLEVLVRLTILRHLFIEPEKVLDLIQKNDPIHRRLNQYRNNFGVIK